MATLLAKRNRSDTVGWADRHDRAIMTPTLNSFESAISKLAHGWADYAREHYRRYDAFIGDDGVLGDEWIKIGLGLRGLLNGELGRIDAGTMDAFILNTIRENHGETQD